MQYVGARYVPKFMGTYVNTQSYENMCVVDNGLGTSYISKKPTPAGTPLTDTDYWAIYGASSGAIINLQNQIDKITDGFVTPEMFGAVGDGITDDTQAINDAIAAATNVVFLNKTYAVDASVSVLPKTGTRLYLGNATLKAIATPPDDSHVIYITNVDNVCVYGGHIDGTRGLDHSQYGHGISIETATNVTIDGVDIKDCKGDGVYIGSIYTDDSWTVVYPSKHVTVRNCIIKNCGRNGMSPVAVNGLVIKDCTIEDIQGENPQAGIDVEVNNDSYPVTDFLLDGLVIKNCVGEELILPRAVEDGIISNCVLYGTLRIERAKNLIVDNCYCDNIIHVDAFDGHAPIFNNCVTERVEIGQHSVYELTFNNCKIGLGIRTGQAIILALNRSGEDISNYCSLVLNNCDISDNATDLAFNFTKILKNLTIKNSKISCTHGRINVAASEFVDYISDNFVGGHPSQEVYAPSFKVKDCVINTVSSSYGYIFAAEQSTDLRVSGNTIYGEGESTFIRANYGYNPSGAIVFNDGIGLTNMATLDASATATVSNNVI